MTATNYNTAFEKLKQQILKPSIMTRDQEIILQNATTMLAAAGSDIFKVAKQLSFDNKEFALKLSEGLEFVTKGTVMILSEMQSVPA